MNNDDFNRLSGIKDQNQTPVIQEVEPDLERYRWLLKGTKVPDEQADEFLRTLWSIMAGFVRLGFEVDACGYLLAGIDPDTASDLDAVNFTSSNNMETPSDGGGKEGSR